MKRAANPMRAVLFWVAIVAVVLAAAGGLALLRSHARAPLTTFDAAWAIVEQNYFDPQFAGVDWRAARERYRPAAARATHTYQLYAEAIWPMLDSIKASRLGASPPADATLPLGYRFTVPAAWSHRGAPLLLPDLGGVSIANDGRQFVVVDLQAGSEPERLGVELGWVATSASLEGEPRAAPSRYRVHVTFVGSAEQRREARKLVWDFEPSGTRPAFEARRRPDGVLLIRFDRFDKETIDRVLVRLMEAETRGVILDLRTNTGGSLPEFERLASALLRADSAVGAEISRRRKAVMSRAKGGWLYSRPLAVLVGLRTEGVGEMLAAALADNRRAAVVGERTAGAVRMARTWRLPAGGQPSVPVRDFRRPSGARIESVGVSPSVEAVQTTDALRAGRDLVVEAAEAALANAH